MIRELHERRKSALLLVFEPSPEGSYDLADVPDAKIKCIATEDINSRGSPNWSPASASVSLSRKPAATRAVHRTQSASAPAPSRRRRTASSMVGRLSGTVHGPDEPYEIKGDWLGMTMADFKQKYARFTPDGRQDLPICSDMPGYIGKAELHGEAWHRKANIVHARVDNPLGRKFADGRRREDRSVPVPIRRRPAVPHLRLVRHRPVPPGQRGRAAEVWQTDARNQAAAGTDLGKQRLARSSSHAARSIRGPIRRCTWCTRN